MDAEEQTMDFDCIIENGTILDGSGREAFAADVGISNGTIAAIGDLRACGAARVIDAGGKTVTPGFVDIHRHADAAVFRDGFGEAELRQGLTTVLNGNCGLSVTPVAGEHAAAAEAYLYPVTGPLGPIPTGSLSAYRDALKCRPLPIHAGMLVGLGTVRVCVAGFRAGLDDADVDAIHRLLERELSSGALGVSLGLGYAPDCFFDTEGLIRALEPIRNSDVVLSAHMRSESMNLLESIDEVLTVAKALNVPLEISHLKAVGKARRGNLIRDALHRIDAAREDGLDVSCDAYPYTAGSTQLLHVLPPEFLEGGTETIAARLKDAQMQKRLLERFRTGTDYDNYAMLIGWDNIRISSVRNDEDRKYVGMTVKEAAGTEDPGRFAANLLAREKCAVTMIDRLTDEDDIAAIYQRPYASVISDATYPVRGLWHPRVYGTFAHVIERFVNERKSLSLADAVHKMTRLPADRYGLRSKGRIEVGADADILVFDPKRVHARSTFIDPQALSEGFETVLVSGTPAVENGRVSGRCGGTVLER